MTEIVSHQGSYIVFQIIWFLDTAWMITLGALLYTWYAGSAINDKFVTPCPATSPGPYVWSKDVCLKAAPVY